MPITIPELSLVILVGTSGAGKSTFARTHFKPTEVISSDQCRGLVSDDENSLDATDDAFELLHFLAAKRLKRGLLTVIDATNVQPEARKNLLNLARKYHCLPILIILDIPAAICLERNKNRSDRNFGSHVIRRQRDQLRRSMKGLKREGFRYVNKLSSPEEVESVEIVRQKLWTNKRDESGPFDIIGDVHGCCDELEELLSTLGYQAEDIPEDQRDVASEFYSRVYRHPEGRRAIFVGDIVDRGPRVLPALLLVRNMVSQGSGVCVPGNHDVKLLKKLRGKNVQIRHGLEQTVAEIDALSEDEQRTILPHLEDFIDSLVSHYVFDDGNLVVAHGGMKEDLQGRASGTVRSFALFGDTTGETDEFGFPVRFNWASEYRGKAMVVYGHTPVVEATWQNNTINIDTGCVFGGKLTALRYPEREIISVPAQQVYAEPVRPPEGSANSDISVEQDYDTLLDISDVIGKRIIQTQLMGGITVRAENSAAALEVMSRFAVDPRWLIYLPPTMSPVKTSDHPEYLERPEQGFEYYRRENVEKVICEEKHMGSRAVVVLCRDGEVARKRFGVSGEEAGIIYTRTGRRFFKDHALETALLDRVRTALTDTGFWEQLQTDWVCLDCELMPWSAKAQALLQEQYGAVGASARESLSATSRVLDMAQKRGLGVEMLQEKYAEREGMVAQYTAAYGAYCWSVESLDDLRLAPFHILATEGAVHADKDHSWHMETIAQFTADRSPLFSTNYKVIDLQNKKNVEDGVQWWEELTGNGGEGMVIKPYDFVHRGQRGLSQPAVKVRGREYLRIIYGPEYSVPANLERLRSRGLSAKRSLALREFALGLEGLTRFVGFSPLRLVHEAVFGVLALESTPVDPRL